MWIEFLLLNHTLWEHFDVLSAECFIFSINYIDFHQTIQRRIKTLTYVICSIIINFIKDYWSYRVRQYSQSYSSFLVLLLKYFVVKYSINSRNFLFSKSRFSLHQSSTSISEQPFSASIWHSKNFQIYGCINKEGRLG